MNEKIPYTPLATRLSSSARETELRLRNIFSGPKRRPPALFLALVFAVCLLCGNLVSFRSVAAPEPSGAPDSSVDTPDPSTLPSGIDALNLEFYTALNGYYQAYYLSDGWYWGTDVPDQPQQWDVRLGPVEYLGSGYVGTRLGSAYTVERRSYREESGGWTEPVIDAFAIERQEDGAFGSVVRVVSYTEGLTAEDIVFRAFHDLFRPELVLYQEDNPYPLGAWSTHFVDYAANYVLNSEPRIEVREDQEPFYGENDYWATLSWDGLSAVCYFDSTRGVYLPSIIDVTRADLYTSQGVRVGDSRAAVREAYPELEDVTAPDSVFALWGLDLEGADALMYKCNFNDVLLFFFEGDTVSRMVLFYINY